MRQRSVHSGSSLNNGATSLHNTEYGSADFENGEGYSPFYNSPGDKFHNTKNKNRYTYNEYPLRTASITHAPFIRAHKAFPLKQTGFINIYFILSILFNTVLTLALIHYRSCSTNDRSVLESLQKKQRTTTNDYESRIHTLIKEQKSLQNDLISKNSQIENNNRNKEVIDNITKEKLELELKIKDLLEHANDHNDLHVEKVNILKDLEVMTRRESAYEQRVNILKEKIGRESEREALERFGPGPHKVKFEVELPQDNMRDSHLINGQFSEFTIELHPLAHLPHSVHLFLEQVHHKLWDGCSFVVNAPHILQAGAHPGKRNGDSFDDKMVPFAEAKLDILSYQEYNEEFPHKQWTVGFAGRPGGPDFYINKIDNTLNHGPGGQEHHDLHEEADPCFGKVVDGFDTIQRLIQEPHNNAAMGFVLKNPVHIIKASIIDLNVKKTNHGDVNLV